MKTRSKLPSLVEPLVLLVLFVVGSLVARVLASPVPVLVGLGLVALATRVWVMAAAIEEERRAAPPPAAAREPVLRAANG